MAIDKTGVPEGAARGYEEHARKGSILLIVHAAGDGQVREARAAFERASGSDARVYLAPTP